jgi:predicted Zn-dependent peptidase
MSTFNSSGVAPKKFNGTTRHFTFAFIFLMVAMLQTSHAQIDRSRQPSADPAPAVTFPAYEEITLANGLRVFFVHDDSPIVTMRLLVRGGSGLDGDTPGLADAVADMITKGTRQRSAAEFADAIDFVGGSISGSGSSDAISVSASGLRKHVATIAELFSEAVKSPAFDNAELAKYLQEQIGSLSSQKARPEFLATAAVNRLMFGSTPYGAMQSEAAYAKITPALLQSFYASRFVPGNATLAVVGSFTRPELSALLEKSFGDWKGGAAPVQKAPVFPVATGRRIILVDRPVSVQSSIRVLGKGPLLRDSDRPLSSILNSILGGGTGLGNRLAANLRETHAWTYSPYSYFDANYYKGYFVAAADVRNEVTDSALTELFSEIKRMGSEPVAPDELMRNKQSAIGNYLMSVSNPTTTAVRVQSIDFYGLPKDYYQKLVAAYESVTPDVVQRLAKSYLNPEDLQVVVVGKASEIRSKLEAFGKVEVWNQDLESPKTVVIPDLRPSSSTADKVWAKMLAALGGETNLLALTSLETKGTLEASFQGQAISGTYKKIEQAPSRQYLEFGLGGMNQVQIVDGPRAWMGIPGHGMKEISGEELADAIDGSNFMPEARVAELNAKLDLLGEREMEGKSVYVVAMRYESGEVATYYIDKKSYLPIVQESSRGNRVAIRSWVTQGKLKFPGELDFEQGGQRTMRLTKLSYKLNPPVDPALFNAK